MAIEAELDDGTILEFPDGTDQSVIDRTVKRHVAESLASTRAAKPKAAPQVMSREDAIKARARKEYEADRSKNLIKDIPVIGAATDLLDAAGASAANFLGVGPNIVAGVRSLKHGTPFRDEQIYAQERNRLERERSLTGDIIGSVAGGAGAVGAVDAGVNALSRVAPRAGNFLSRTINLQPGQKLANAARIVGGGAVAGGAQAMGEGNDVGEGALYGAVAAPVATIGLGLGRSVASRVRNFTRPGSRNVERGLQEVITEDPAVLAQRQADLSARTGNNEPLIGALNNEDFDNVSEKLLKGSRAANDVAQRETAYNARTLPDRMLQHVERAGTQGGARMQDTVEELTRLRKETSDAQMAPIQDNILDLNLIDIDGLEGRLLKQIGMRDQGLKSRIEKTFRPYTQDELKRVGVKGSGNANKDRRTLAQFGFIKPQEVTVRELDNLRRELESAARASTSRPGDSKAYSNAADRVREFVDAVYPDYGKMIDTSAANARMIEGFEHAAAGRRISDVDTYLMSENLRSKEGRIGMKAGEVFRQREAAGKSPSSALSLARDFAAEGKLTRQANPLNPNAAQPGTVTENLGPTPAKMLADAGAVEYETARRMAQAQGVDVTKETAEALDNPETLAYGVSLLAPGAMVLTRARFVANLIRNLPSGFSPQVAENITEMLFSRDPAQTQRALNALQRIGITPKEVGSQIATVAAGAAGGRAADPTTPPASPQQAAGTFMIEDSPPGLVEPGNIDLDARKVLQDGPNYKTEESISIGTDKGETIIPTVVDGKKLTDKEAIQHYRDTGENLGTFRTPKEAEDYAQRLHLRQQEHYKPQASEDQQFDTLANKVEQVESAGSQNAVSSKGAIGVMQVMPGTGPEAAELAGVEWDPKRFKTDEAYNRQLGRAYLKEMLNQFNGDETLAVAAYNAGPGAVRRALAKGGDWVALLPAETQDYIQKVLG